MKNFSACIKKIVFVCLLLLAFQKTFANHLVGMDMYYTHITGNTYKIYLVAYGNCGSGGSGTAFESLPYATPTVYVYNAGSLVTSLTLAIEPPSTGSEITPVCPADLLLTQCTNISYTIPGIKKFVYSATYTVPTTSQYWRFLFTGELGGGFIAGRATSITNISSTPDTYIQLIDTLNNLAGFNNSPNLSVVPTPFFCLNNADNYNPGAIDVDGDVLRFFLVDGRSGTITSATGPSVTYLPPYTGTSPLGVTTMSFDPATGQISFYPNIIQRSLVVYNVEERRGGVLVGTSQREMTFLVLTCTNTPATGSMTGATNGIIDDSTHFHICLNSGTFSFSINPHEPDSLNNITVTYSGLPAGATFTTIGNGTPHPHCTFSWTSTSVTPGTYTFYVTFTDNNCPLAGVQTLAYTVTILPVPTITYTLLSTVSCVAKARISIIPGGSGPWTVKVSDAPGDTIQTFTGVTGTFTDSLGPGNYTITVFSPSGCSAFVTFTIANPPNMVPTGTFTNPTYCGASDGTIKLFHLWPGTIDTIRFTYNGVAQPPRVLTVAPDSTVTITGLSAGVYTGITATYGNCTSTSVGPITLVNPPFTMRAVSFTNPTWCGSCDGTIRLYGLHPGQLDTLNFNLGGVPQTPIVRMIGSDSQIVLTGMCQGTYTNFIAKTAGICVSPTLGPITLTVPPFTMRAITYVNPTWCGLCDGSITLYGLHPGDVDTITYTYFGVPQPPIHCTILADSTVHITGLCNGVYANFVATKTSGCVSNALGPVTLTVPPFTMRSLSSTNPSWCGICDGTITLYGLHPSETDTIFFTRNGIPQPPVVHYVGLDSIVVLTGMCSGTYTDITAHTLGNCISNSLGPVTLTVPPFTIRALSHVNPDYCGICNGSITIYGAHPGQLDTISYTYNGTPQPPIFQLVSIDSTITLTGLCAGVYDNFIARTGGVCVSNTLGPEMLTIPPFTIRALSKVNPDYCGNCNGSITIYGIHPGQTDTIRYKYNGVWQPGIVRTIGADSMVTINGLCQGIYDSFVANTGGVCVSNFLGPTTLTVPPFTISYLSYTNPTKCGFCDGVIKVHGCHPGQTDTVYYTLNGVQQTPVRAIIGADSVITLAGLCKGVYDSFVVRTGGMCVSNMLGPDTLKDPPIIPAFITDIHLGCKGDTVYFINQSTPASDLTYRWFFGDGLTDITTDPTHMYFYPGSYTIKLIITNTKCYDSISHTIALDNLISAGFTSNPDSFVCQDSLVTFTNTSAGTNLGYTWIFGDGTIDSVTNPNHIFKYTGTYEVVLAVTNYVPCFDTVKKYITVDSTSLISIVASDSVICRIGTITFTGNYSPMGNIGVNWTIGTTSNFQNVNPIVLSFDNAGSYNIIITSFYRACPTVSASTNVTVIDNPQIDLGKDTTICPGENGIRLTDYINMNNPLAHWLWNTDQVTSSILVGQPGIYYAMVTIKGCSNTDTVVVTKDCYMDIPNVFTPNGDGVNDYFYPRQFLSKGLINFNMEIYNRWGEKIFEAKTVDGRGWDGRYNDVPQPEGVYIYVIDGEFKDGQHEHHKGNVTLLR